MFFREEPKEILCGPIPTNDDNEYNIVKVCEKKHLNDYFFQPGGFHMTLLFCE